MGLDTAPADPTGRENLLCYVLRPPITQAPARRHGAHRPQTRLCGRALAVEMDPLSLLCPPYWKSTVLRRKASA